MGNFIVGAILGVVVGYFAGLLFAYRESRRLIAELMP
jgi:gas vesicle protein